MRTAADIDAALARRWFLGALGATLIFRAWLAVVVPFTGDEAYFLVWGRQPAIGYYDHPPMVGWMLALLAPINLRDLAAQERNPFLNHAAVNFDLPLARPARPHAAHRSRGRTAARPRDALQVRPQSAKPRGRVLKLGQLDLQLRLPRLGPRGEDVEDQLASVDDLPPDRFFQPADLDRKSTRLNSSHIQKSRMPSSA